MTTIKLVDKLPKEAEEKMHSGFLEYETANGISINYKSFSLILTNNEEVVGVLNAYTAFAEIYIDDIWVDSAHRCKGFGIKLIQNLEERFKNKGFNNINLVTSAFQAPEFYKKCGFKLEFVRKNFKNPKLTKYFFIKYFNDIVQTQGVIKLG
jgi:ribosomal protein S18 acetylase RimI-like enzyme